MDDGFLKEIHAATGGAHGGTSVDEKYRHLLEEIVGESALKTLRDSDMFGYFDIDREFEIKKRKIRADGVGKIVARIPVQLSEEAQSMGKNIEQRIEASKFKGEIKHTRDRLVFEHKIIKDLFTESIDAIMRFAMEVTSEHPNIKTILMVGGYAGCELVRERLRSEMPDIKVIVPKESGLAVLKGAVMYGHNPKVITSRKLRYTYGERTCVTYEEGVHPQSHKFVDEDDVSLCKDAFHILLAMNTTVDSSGEVVRKRVYPVFRNQCSMTTEVYCSTKENPILTDDESCTFVGELTYDIPQYKGDGEDDRYVEETFTFGLSELLVEVFVPGTGEKLASEFKLL